MTDALVQGEKIMGSTNMAQSAQVIAKLGCHIFTINSVNHFTFPNELNDSTVNGSEL